MLRRSLPSSPAAATLPHHRLFSETKKLRDCPFCGVFKVKKPTGSAREKDTNMKNLSNVVFAATLLTTLSLANSARAELKATADDGIAASPKVRQLLTEKAANKRGGTAGPTIAVAYRGPGLEGITASPKALQMLAERKVVASGASAVEVATAGYRPTGADGITASPKLRAQLDERSTPILVAPLK
jgi:hypothetical protein